MPESSHLKDRVTRLEESFSHQEHLIEQLNKVVIQLREDIEKLESKHEVQKRHLTQLLENVPVSENPADEKPPHY